MSLAKLLTKPVTLIYRDETGPDDGYGNPTATVTEAETVCEFQQVASVEPSGAGELSDTRWRLYLPAGTDLDTGDGAVIDGHRYEVVGAPEHVENFRLREESHVEATLRRTAGAGEVS